MEVGFCINDLFHLDYGFISDVLIEAGNDREKYDYKATQEDINEFFH